MRCKLILVRRKRKAILEDRNQETTSKDRVLLKESKDQPYGV